MIERITVAVGPIEGSNVAIAPVLLTVKIEESCCALPVIILLPFFKFLAYFASDIPDILAVTGVPPFQSSTKVCESPAASVYVIFNEPFVSSAESAFTAEYTLSIVTDSPTVLYVDLPALSSGILILNSFVRDVALSA